MRRMRAITIYRPYPDAILYLGKDLENRSRPPAATIMGEVIALHAGLVYDTAGAELMRSRGLSVPSETNSPKGCIVGTARVTGYVTESDSPWFVGPYGWQLADVEAFNMPFMCTGAQGLWFVPEGLLEAAPEALTRQGELF